MNREQLKSAKKLFFTLLGIDIGATAIVGLSAFSTVGTLREVQSGARIIDQSMISSLEFWDGFSKLLFLTLIGVGLGLVKWLNACYSFAKQTIGATGFKNEGWTAAGWIIPIFNLFKPYQIINEIYKAGSSGYTASDDWKKESGSGALLTWWIFWAVTHFIGWIMTKQLMRSALRDDITIPQAIGLTELQAWSCVISLVIAGLWFWVANLITQRLVDRDATPAKVQSVQYAFHAPVAAPIAATPPISPAAHAPPLTAPQQPAMSAQTAPPPTTVHQATVLDEDAVYEIVANEIESGKTDKGLWTRLYAEFDGDEKRTKIAYIKQRAEKLMVAERVRIEQRQREEEEQLRQAEEDRLRRMTIREKLQKNLIGPEEAAKFADGFSTQFLLTCQRGTEDQVEEMLKQRPVLVAVTNSEGYTGLHIAVQEGREQMVKLLIEHGSNPDAQNQYGLTSYDLAMRKCAENISEYPVYRKIADLIKSAVRP